MTSIQDTKEIAYRLICIRPRSKQQLLKVSEYVHVAANMQTLNGGSFDILEKGGLYSKKS